MATAFRAATNRAADAASAIEDLMGEADRRFRPCECQEALRGLHEEAWPLAERAQAADDAGDAAEAGRLAALVEGLLVRAQDEFGDAKPEREPKWRRGWRGLV
jgi:hypothetical protein